LTDPRRLSQRRLDELTALQQRLVVKNKKNSMQCDFVQKAEAKYRQNSEPCSSEDIYAVSK
jgi:hypothetical protein